MRIRTSLIPELTIARFRRLKDVVDLNPPYQREGGIWGVDTLANLIDSIINGLDIPKLYFEVATSRRFTPEGLTYQYAVIDGKQRLEAITSFLSGELRLAEDFRFFEDEEVMAEGLTLTDLQERYPALAQRFLDFELPIVSVDTDSGDLIEEMFQRLNASSSLNAAERRNAISGPTRDAANELAQHDLLISRSPIKNARYKYRELGAKFLAIEHQLATRGYVSDTKSDTLYRLFTAAHGDNPTITAAEMQGYQDLAQATLDRMSSVFNENDPLLSSIGTVVVYYIVFRDNAVAGIMDRTRLQEFEELRRRASRLNEDDPEYGIAENVRLREYNVLVQSTNDGKALEHRAQILTAFLSGRTDADSLAGLGDLAEVSEVPADDEVQS
jgi:Protein of unknown function DUF262